MTDLLKRLRKQPPSPEEAQTTFDELEARREKIVTEREEVAARRQAILTSRPD